MGRAHQLDPLSRQIGVEWGWVSYLMHRNDEAETHIRQVLELDPNYAQAHLRLGLVQIQQRRYPQAIASIQRAIDLGAFYPHAAAALAYAYAVSGNPEAARKIVNDLKRRSARELVPPFTIAVAYAGLGDARQGIAWLERGMEQRDIYIPENFFEPLLDPLRADPAFEPAVTRMGLGAKPHDSAGPRPR
jgi:tetratricopeptide (TPR) repeat protein